MKLTLVKKTPESFGTYSFFYKPDVEFDWTPGQYMYLTVPKLKYPDPRGDTRHFTISNSPTEKGFVQITTRIRQESGYKKTLNDTDIGSVLEAKGPNGYFIFDEKTNKKIKNNLFFAGGIGITPFRSFIKYNLDTSMGVPMHLVYSNSDENFVFKKELDTWTNENDHISVNYIDTSKEKRLDREKFLKITSKIDVSDTLFWVVGPPPFVSSLEDILENTKIPENNIKTEKFTGY